MKDRTQTIDGAHAASIDAASNSALPKAPYTAPVAEILGSATALVQGGGGSSGTDRNAYYYRLPGE